MDEKLITNEAASQHPNYKNEIVSLVRSNLSPKVLRDKVLDYHEMDIAAALDLLQPQERTRLYRLLESGVLAQILSYSDQMKQYLDELSIKKKIAVLSNMETAEIVDYLASLDKRDKDTLLDLLDEEVQQEVKLLSSYDEDEIGSRMTTNYIAIQTGLSIKAAMSSLIAQAAEHDNISTLYVVDENDLFVGAIPLKDLIIARNGSEALEDITMTSYPYVYANEQIENCIERLKNYSEDSIPVLDAENRLQGVLISQEITQMVDDELGEDYARLAGLSSEEDLHEPLKLSITKRLPWLFILLGLGLVVSSVVGAFEAVVAQLTLIMSFQSLILDMAGNVGTQSLAVTIRVLMDENISGKEKLALVWKESKVGLINGLILGLVSIAFISFYLVVLKSQPWTVSFGVAICVGIALLVSILLSSVVGTVVPLLFKRLNIDPAVASGPLITTINDLVAVVVYYGLAWLLLVNHVLV